MQSAPHQHETILEVDAPRVKFGRGAIDEVGPEAAAAGLRRVALFTDARLAKLEFVERARRSLRGAGLRRVLVLTDARLAKLEFVERARRSLRGAGVDVAEFDRVRIEPTDGS